MGRRWQGVILGEPASKANRRRPGINPQTGKAIIRKSKKASEYKRTARLQLAFIRAKPLLKGRVKATVVVYYRTERSDLDVEVLFDAMEGFVYSNDRQVREKHLYHTIDRDNPRCEVLVEGLK